MPNFAALSRQTILDTLDRVDAREVSGGARPVHYRPQALAHPARGFWLLGPDWCQHPEDIALSDGVNRA